MRNLRKLSKAIFVGSIAAEYHLDEASSSDVHPKLAKIINKMIWTKFSDDKFKEKLSNCSRPGNCENIIGTKVNPGVSSKIRSGMRSRDLKHQRLQNESNDPSDQTYGSV